MENIMKIVKSLEDSGLLIKGVTQTIKNATKGQISWQISWYVRYIRCKVIRKVVTMNMTGPPKNIWIFCITIEHKSSYEIFFLLIYCKNITNFLFWVYWTCLNTSIKNNMPTCKKRFSVDVYLYAKNKLYP